MAYDARSKRRIANAVRTVERMDMTIPQPGMKPRIQDTMLRFVKPTENLVAGADPIECQVWDGEADTGQTLLAKWGWGSTDGTQIASGAQCIATRYRHGQDWYIIGWDCDSVEPVPGAPLGNPPQAIANVYHGYLDEVIFDSEPTIAAAGESITKHQWVAVLPSSNFLIIAGNDGSPPNFVHDSRGTLDINSVGTIITGNVERLSIDESEASISAPYDVSILVTQSDTQTDTATASAGLNSGNVAIDGTDATLTYTPI